jgi:methylmalonyl-CoA mutase
VGVNCFREDDARSRSSRSTTLRRSRQIEKLKRLRAERSQADVDAALEALSRCATRATATSWTSRELPAQATGGEISLALEKSGAPRGNQSHLVGLPQEVGRMSKRSNNPATRRTLDNDDGRRPRILAQRWAKTATTGPKVIASAFADLGFDVDIGPLFATPRGGPSAIENDVHIVGISSLAAGT